jgi:hypothetical protein
VRLGWGKGAKKGKQGEGDKEKRKWRKGEVKERK